MLLLLDKVIPIQQLTTLSTKLENFSRFFLLEITNTNGKSVSGHWYSYCKLMQKILNVELKTIDL